MRAVQATYDRIAARYAESSYSDKPHEEYVDRSLLDLLASRVQGTVCDLGCGPGQHTRYLHEKGVAVVGVDLSAGMIAQASQRNPGLAFIQASMYRLPVPADSWGGMVAFHSLSHIPRGEVLQVLRELRRVLRPGGWLLLAVHRGQVTLQSRRWKHVPIDMSFTHFKTSEMQGYLRKAGFSVEGVLEVERPDPQTFLFAQKPGSG